MAPEYKDVYRLHRDELEAISSPEKEKTGLLNSMQGAGFASGENFNNPAGLETPEGPDLHGWVYGLKDGLLNTVFTMSAESSLDPLYTYNDLGAE